MGMGGGLGYTWEVGLLIRRALVSYFSSVAQLCLTLCDPKDCSMPGLPVHHQLPEFTQNHGHQVILRPSAFFIVQLSHPYMTTEKTKAFTRRTFVGKVMSLLFNMLSRLVITFLLRSKCLLISWLKSPSAVTLEPPKMKSVTVHCFPIYLPWSDGTRCHDLSFLNVEF